MRDGQPTLLATTSTVAFSAQRIKTGFMAANENPQNPQVLVLGGGFGGLTFCQHFRHPSARVTIVDRTNHYLFQPLLYQVATAGLSAPEIAQPIRAILADRQNVTVLFGQVIDFNLPQRQVM